MTDTLLDTNPSLSLNTTEQTDTDQIKNDVEFLEHVKKVKKLLDIDVDDIKPQQAVLIREEIVTILEYVMKQIEAEEAEEEAEAEEPQETGSASPALQPSTLAPQQGGKKSHKSHKSYKSRKQKGGAQDIDMKRVSKVSSLVDPSHNPENITRSPDITIAANVPRSFTVGDESGFTSTNGMDTSLINTILPTYGTQQGGGRRARVRKVIKA